MTNNILRNGIFGGLIAAAVMAAMVFYMKANPGVQPNAVIGFMSMMVAFAFLVMGIKKDRENNDDKISFGKAFLVGLGISFVISTFYVVAWLVLFYNYFPDFIERYSSMVLKNTSPEELASKTAEMNQMKEWYKSPLMIILLTFMEIFPLGILISIVAGWFMKKK